jgi:hypothetical protein
MAGGASSSNMDDTFVAATFEARILPELRPSTTSRSFIRWAPAGNSPAHSFSLLGDPGPSGAMTEGTDFTSVTDITTTKQTATVGEVGILTTVSDVLIKVSLLDAVATTSAQLTRSTLEKWETDVAGIADNFSTSTTAAGTLTPADLLAAISAIEQRDAATGPLVAYLHPKQTGELRGETVNTTAIRFGSDDGGLANGVPVGAVTGETNGRGYFGNLFEVDIWQTSLVASSSSLRQGSVFVSGQCIGAKELWAPRVETERRASLRGFYVVSSACYGVAGVETTSRGQMLKSAA